MVELCSFSSVDDEVGFELGEREGEWEDHSDGDSSVESDNEFKLLEPLAEPLDEDQPSRWPLPECSFLGVNGAAALKDQHIWKKPLEESYPRKLKSLLVTPEIPNPQLKDEGIWTDWFTWNFRKKSEPSKSSKDTSGSHSNNEGIQKEVTGSRTFRKRLEPFVSKDDSPIKASTKRHHRISPDVSAACSSKSHPTNFLQVLQQCKEFEI